MAERLRAFLERPLDPVVARAILVLGAAVCLGFGVVVCQGLIGAGPRASHAVPTATPVRASRAEDRPSTSTTRPRQEEEGRRPRQDPQDRPGPAAVRAHRELGTHRALQHLPYRRGELSIELIGAVGSKAVLAVRGSGLRAARRGYRSFLRSRHDDGTAYLPDFHRRGQRRG